MTDIINADENTANMENMELEQPTEAQAEVVADATPPMLPKLTVGQFIADMSRFDQESELVASLFGIGLTIPIFQAIAVEADNKKLTVLQISKQGAIQALLHAEQMQEAENATHN